MFDMEWKLALKSTSTISYPLLPVLETRFWSVPFCRSWLFMMASCLCFRSISLALTSSSTHRSDKSGTRSLDNGNNESNINIIIKFNWKVEEKSLWIHLEAFHPGQTLRLNWLHWPPAVPPFGSVQWNQTHWMWRKKGWWSGCFCQYAALTWPQQEAACRGVHPSVSFTSTWALCSSSSSATDK